MTLNKVALSFPTSCLEIQENVKCKISKSEWIELHDCFWKNETVWEKKLFIKHMNSFYLPKDSHRKIIIIGGELWFRGRKLLLNGDIYNSRKFPTKTSG